MSRYVILEHDHPFLHWDLMLQQPGSDELQTWRLLARPQANRAIPAEPLPDHRAVYLDYEGPVSRNRGHVRRWDAGHFTREPSPDGTLILRLRDSQQGFQRARLTRGTWTLS